MRHQKSFDAPKFVEYNDNNLEHALAGPDYGQSDSRSCWTEMDSEEYPEYVEKISLQILARSRIKILTD